MRYDLEFVINQAKLDPRQNDPGIFIKDNVLA